MSEQMNMIVDSLERLFVDLAAMDPQLPESWQMIEDMGVCNLFLDESEGGMDASWVDAEPALRLLGLRSVALPVGETMIARHLLSAAGLPVPQGPIAMAMGKGEWSEGEGFSGSVTLPSIFPSSMHVIVAIDKPGNGASMLLDATDARSAPGGNREDGGGARPTLHFANCPAQLLANCSPDRLMALGAFLRTAQIAGALAAALDLTIEYAKIRSQFGRELRKFQAIQQQIAVLSEEVAAIASASASSALAMDIGSGRFAVACAKLRANQAAGAGALIAHQVHGAIGITAEYSLHRFTNALWQWRSDFGNDRYWAERIGRRILVEDAGSPWSILTKESLA
tara:strand:+ start:194 stop:1210 length:1017 start_codon:yes stop_codon:yes gene_type:complete